MKPRLLFRSCAPLFLMICLVSTGSAATTTDSHATLHDPTAGNAGVIATPSHPIPGVDEPVPPMLQPLASAPAPAPEPTTPPARTFHDSQYGVSFVVPAAWDVTRKDSDVSTFNLDARSAVRATKMRAVATINFNPYPLATFSGALFYFSVTPHITPEQCSSQATAKSPRNVSTAQIGGLSFTHGHDEHGVICTEARDEIYTASRNDACYRFDLVINTYCGGDVSGVKDITPDELESVRSRMRAILDSVHFDPN